jgi:CRISPR-associated protein Csm2
MVGLSNTQKERIKTIIVGGGAESATILVEEAKRIGRELADMKFSTNQIRNIFGVVRSIEQRVDRDFMHEVNGDSDKTQSLADGAYRQLQLIRPKLAYQHGRATNTVKERKKDAMELLKDVLDAAIDFVEQDRERFSRFVEFFEAILAYHRSAGGKD